AFNLNTGSFANNLDGGTFRLELANGNNDLVLRFVHPPVVTCPPNVAAQCTSSAPAAATDSASFMAQAGTISSDCGGALTVTSSDATSPGGCPNQFTIVRTATASATCG